MLTLLKNIERFNKRYNKKRGSAMLMVLMTMAIIIVVGSSMLFVTLSSFSNSIADTHQERAYNAAIAMIETLKNSGNLGDIIESHADTLKDDKPAQLKFFNNASIEPSEENYTIINGVKVYVTFINKSEDKLSLNKVLIDVKGVKGSQESQVSFTFDKKIKTKDVTLEDTFGNAFVMNNGMGGEAKDKNLVFKRIEGDISINCWDEVVDSNGNTVLDEKGNPKKTMTTRYFNPIILEGLTGSIFANGDVIIGSYDNVIKVHGNIYCDGNLTIRGLNLGINLPAVFKKDYNKKFIKYSTIGNKTIFGFEILGTGEYKERIGSGIVNEAMYLKYTTENGDDDFLPLQVYDEVSHYTLVDLKIDKFYTRVYLDDNGNQVYGADGKIEEVEVKEKPNSKYYGATMYSTPECKPEDMIMQYPQGGNIYCSGDIIFDRVNSGYSWVYSANIGGAKENQYRDLGVYDGTGKGKIDLSTDKSKKKALELIENGAVSYNQSKISGDVFCLGRMIIAPENLGLVVPNEGYKDDAIVFTKMNGSHYGGASFNGYLDANNIKKQIYSSGDTFFARVKELLGFSNDSNSWNHYVGKYSYKYNNENRLTWKHVDKKLEKSDGYIDTDNYKKGVGSFIEQLRSGQLYTDLKNMFKNAIKNNADGNLYNTNYIIKGDGYVTGMGTGKEHYKLRPIEFSKTSNFYIYNWSYETLIKKQLKPNEDIPENAISRRLNSTSLVEEARTDKDLTTTDVSTVNGVTYKSALTVKYQTIDVDKIFVGSGNVEAVGINVFGYNSGKGVNAGINANEIDTKGGKLISNEYQEWSILDVIMKINKCTEEQALEILKKNYWKFDDNDNTYNGVGDIGIVVNDREKDRRSFTGSWTAEDRDGIVIGYSVTYDVNVVATYKAVKVEYNAIDVGKTTAHVTYQLDNLSDKQYKFQKFNAKYFLYKVKKSKYLTASVCNENDDDIAEVFNGEVFKGQEIENISDDKIKEYITVNTEILTKCFGGDVNVYKDFICDYVKGNGQKFSSGFIFDLDKKESETIAQDNTQFDFVKTYEKTYYASSYNPDSHYYQNEQQTKSYSVNYYIKPLYVTDKNGNKVLDTSYDKTEIILKYDSVKDTLISFVKDVKQLALVSSDASNSFNGIVVNDLNIITGKKTTSVGESVFNTTRAFYDNDGDHAFLGMYLRSTNARYENADKNARIIEVFQEILDDGFAKIAVLKTTKLTKELMRKNINDGKIIVDEYNNVEDVRKDDNLNPLKALEQNWCHLQELQEGSNVYKIEVLDKWANEGNPRGYTNFYTADSLASVRGKTNSGHYDNVWTYVRYKSIGLSPDNTFYSIFNTNKKDDNVRVLRFTNTANKEGPALTCDNTFGLDPLYCSYEKDKDGNLVPVGGNKGGVFVNLLPTIRTQVDYTISSKKLDEKANKNIPRGVYFNFSGESGGINTKLEGQTVIFGASTDDTFIDKLKQINDTKRMNITIDTTYHDVYVYINAPSKYKKVEQGKGSYVKSGDNAYTLVGEGKGDYELQAGIEFRKCSWRVKGSHNAYIMLVGDTSINANAYQLEANTSGGVNSDTADRSDTMLGTHFYSGFYTEYSGSYTMNENNESSLKLAAKEVSTVKSGNLCIIGTMGNQVLLGRGGYINGFVYLPNGRYVNESKGFLGILPNAYSSNNQATIVAQDIAVKGSNIGNLIFQAFDVSASAGGAGSDINIDYIESGDKIITSKWEFGEYYYG